MRKSRSTRRGEEYVEVSLLRLRQTDKKPGTHIYSVHSYIDVLPKNGKIYRSTESILYDDEFLERFY